MEKAKVEVDPMKVFHAAVDNCKPLLQLNSIKRGGQKYQVCTIVSCNAVLAMLVLSHGRTLFPARRLTAASTNSLVLLSANINIHQARSEVPVAFCVWCFSC